MNMDMQTMYNQQMQVMKDMVSELKAINEKLDRANAMGERALAMNEAALTESLGLLENAVLSMGTVDGNALAKSLPDEVEEEAEEQELVCDCLVCVAEKAAIDANELVASKQLPYKSFSSTFYEYDPEEDFKNLSIFINYDKRTVAATLKNGNNKVYKRGIAKCHPSDTFIEEVGVAIAVRRLFDLDIPEFYIQQND